MLLNRILIRLSAGSIAALSLLSPIVAHADVLEIGNGGAQWISGGPVEAGPTEMLPDLANGEATVVDGQLGDRAVTEAADTAGPQRWQARVAELARKYDISPTLLEAVVWQESRWNENAVSPVGARGLAQLMPGTARQMGVNAADPMANLEGGARYLRMQLDAFNGNIEHALAAYNAGPGRVRQAGGVPSIRETKLYVAAIMARLTDPVRR